VSDESGEPIRVFGATQDVTELKRAEEKLKATSEQLARSRSSAVHPRGSSHVASPARSRRTGFVFDQVKVGLELIAKEHPASRRKCRYRRAAGKDPGDVGNY